MPSKKRTRKTLKKGKKLEKTRPLSIKGESGGIKGESADVGHKDWL